MIKFLKIGVFDTDATTIVNTINCDGFMGAGLALEFSLRYPDMLK
jgi:O-acetyl-ADP-ribose deacetylase (regulator of RNase III)